MARPAKYHTQNERLEACKQVQALVREMQEISGWTSEELADAMKLGISGGMLRQYAAGKKPASQQRLIGLANEAVRLHCCGKIAAEIRFWSQAGGGSGTTIFSTEREAKSATRRLEEALNSLHLLGYTKDELLHLTATKLQSLTT